MLYNGGVDRVIDRQRAGQQQARATSIKEHVMQIETTTSPIDGEQILTDASRRSILAATGALDATWDPNDQLVKVIFAHTNWTALPSTKTDANGNYYVSRNDRSGSVWFFRVSPDHLGSAMQEVASVGGDIDAPLVEFVDAGFNRSCEPGVAVDYDPDHAPSRICLV